MTRDGLARSAALLLGLALAISAAAKDVYKGFLDPSNPQHRATLDILARLDQNPNDASLHNDLGCLIARDGFWRDALKEFDIAAKLDKKNGRAHYNAGLVQMTRGKWSAARSEFQKAVDATPGNWPAWWMLGFAEEKLGNANAATSAYATSLRVDTSLFDVKRNPYAIQSRLKARVLLETYDRRMARASLPVTEQLAEPDILTNFQTARVGVVAAPGPPVTDEPAPAPVPRGGGPGGGPVTAPAPAGGGAVVTSVPPVSSSRPTREPTAPVVQPSDARSSGLPEAPPWFPATSSAGPAPTHAPGRPQTEDPGAPPTPVPTPTRPAGAGIG
jgi:hypothetical protein